MVEVFENEVVISVLFINIVFSFDRSVMLKVGEVLVVEVFDYWEFEFVNGIEIFGVISIEMLMVMFILGMDGGMLLDFEGKVGMVYLIVLFMNEIIKYYSNEELVSEFVKLGSVIWFSIVGRYL